MAIIQPKDIQGKVVTSLAELESWAHPNGIGMVADVETFGTEPKDGKLLGVALCYANQPEKPIYVVLQSYDFNTSTWTINPEHSQLIALLATLLSSQSLIGHNYSYDKSWLDYCTGIDTKWSACTRLMWHMASAPSGPRPYGLKDAQIEVLGWPRRGDAELEEQVSARGGKLSSGGHYLANKEVLGWYACLDASSTALLYNHLYPFFTEHDYWWLLDKMVVYSWLLQKCTESGILVDEEALESQIQILSDTKAAYTARFMELASVEIGRLERTWREDRAAKYTLPYARGRFLSSWGMHKKFNLSSDKDKRELFYDILKLPILIETEGGKGSTSLEAINASTATRDDLEPLREAYEQAESAETLLNSFAKPWKGALRRGGLHPRFNPCGTVSYRLSGFKPYLLNAPFDEKELMSCLKCDDGWEGVHADFASIEPAVTAHYSQDPSLLKVFRDGKGDVYLDLALTLFPNDVQLKEGYDPNAPVTSSVKEVFKKQRKIAKIIQLAVQYGGTRYTVSANLTAAGLSTPLNEAGVLVENYWRHFRRVLLMNESLHRKFERDGLLRNAVGRIIRVPTTIKLRKKDGTTWDKPMRYKDLPNRFIQSSAHDLLSLWVLKIAEQVEVRGITAKAMILDCHDSTSWQSPGDHVERLEEVFKETLTELNDEVNMSVPMRIEMKRFNTLAGLKGDEL